MTWMVTGGAGYIGSHVVVAMREAGEDVVVLDDLSSGNRECIDGVPVVVGSVLDGELVGTAMREHGIRGIVHLAGKKQVEESVRRPLYYYRENVEGLRVLLDAATDARVESFVFASSAAVYGAPALDEVHEDAECVPVNPYGRTKLMCEQMLADVAEATGLRYVNFRYFNVAGCSRPELADRGVSNLVPMVIQRLADGAAPRIFGGDYPTPDGSCIRDFIHVADVAAAHVAAVRGLEDGRVSALTANIGRGEGTSVREMVDALRRVTGTSDKPWAEPEVMPRRAGDPPRAVAAVNTIRAALGWEAQRGLDDMVGSAWAGWQRT